MKPGTLVAHRKWGKAFVTEVLERELFVPIRVRWLNPCTHPNGEMVITQIIWQDDLTIISEGE